MFRRSLLCLVLIAAFAGLLHAAPAPQTVTALMVSDVHFEPFADPAKVPQLAAAPVAEWPKILAAPNSPDAQTRFAAIESGCKTRGEDTTYTLFQSSLAAMRTQAPHTHFITISGDLIAHAFPCKWAAAMPNAKPNQYGEFVVKTLDYVLDQFRSTFPAARVYAALGNNDSDCGDYKLDTGSPFLAAAGEAFTRGLPAEEHHDAAESFAGNGSFSVAFPAPFHHTRLLILDDLYMSKKYTTCSGKSDSAAAEQQLTWLKGELDKARTNHEKIWIMGHIPPGIDPYATISKLRNVCGGKDPDMFLSSSDLADTIASYSDVVRLAIFAHTHMDEMRLVEGSGKSVALKMVPSISPVDGNNPAFTIASIDAETSELRNYRVIAASNKTGVDTKWTEEYDFARTYHEPAYTAATVGKILAKFQTDANAESAESQSYLKNYFVGENQSRLLQPFWPQYTCAIGNLSVDSYRQCRCPAGK